jgi:exopolysaccharide production protein ExoQ
MRTDYREWQTGPQSLHAIDQPIASWRNRPFSGDPPPRNVQPHKSTFTQKLENTFVGTVLVASTGALFVFLTERSDTSESIVQPGSMVIQIFFALAYLAGLIILIAQSNPPRLSPFALIVLVGLVAWLLLSVVWSQLPLLTLRRWAAVVGTGVFALYLTSRFNHQRFLRVLGASLAVVCILSLILIAVKPDIGVMQSFSLAGSWRGILAHKNALGRIAVLALTIFIILTFMGSKRFFWSAAALLATILLIGSRSITSILVAASMGICVLLIWLLRNYRTWGIAAFCLVLAAGIVFTVWLAGHWAVVTEAFGKDVGLTGRTALWAASIAQAMEQPWTGYGFNAVWEASQGPAIVIAGTVSAQPHAHNGFIEIWLEVGIVGLVGFVVFLLHYIHRVTRILQRNLGAEHVAAVLFGWFYIVTNISESSFIVGNSLYLIVALYYYMSAAKRLQSFKYETPGRRRAQGCSAPS